MDENALKKAGLRTDMTKFELKIVSDKMILDNLKN